MYCIFSFFFDGPATTEIYTLSLHDALPIFRLDVGRLLVVGGEGVPVGDEEQARVLGLQLDPVLQHAVVVPEMQGDRKSTRLNSSHVAISYAVFCLKKKITTLTFTQELKKET